jgi:hypothetical protein
VLHQPEPGLLQQVFGDVAMIRQPGEKAKQAAVERLVHRIKGRRVARPQALDELELRLAIHLVACIH